MKICLITAVSVIVISSAVLAQQQPTIQVPVPNIPGVTTPQQQRPPYPSQGYPPQNQPYDRGGDYRGGDPSYGNQGRCQDLAYQARDLQDRLNYAPSSGQEHDRLVYQLGQVRNEQQRCPRG